MTRVTDLSQNQLIQSYIADTQARIQSTQIQVSTGQAAQRYAGIASQSNTLVNLESTDSRAKQYVSNNTQITARLNTMDTAVSQLSDIASQLSTLLVNATNGNNASQLALSQQATGLLNQAAGLLNTKFGDSYLFSGTATDTAPVDLNAAGYAAPGNSYPSSADTGYYQGNSTKLVARAADNFDVTYGVTADQPGFEELFRSLQMTATATTSPTVDTARLNEALSVVKQAIADIPTIRSTIGASGNAISAASDEHTTMTTYLEQNITDIKSVDVPSALTKLSSDQTVLEAAYMTTVRLSGLSLVSYMH